MFSILVCLLIHFLCFLGWSVSVFWVDVLGFFLFWLVCAEFSGLLHSVISGLKHFAFSRGNSSPRDSSSTWIFLIHLSYAPHGNRVFET